MYKKRLNIILMALLLVTFSLSGMQKVLGSSSYSPDQPKQHKPDVKVKAEIKNVKTGKSLEVPTKTTVTDLNDGQYYQETAFVITDDMLLDVEPSSQYKDSIEGWDDH